MKLKIEGCDDASCQRTDCPLYQASPVIRARLTSESDDAVVMCCIPKWRAVVVKTLQNQTVRLTTTHSVRHNQPTSRVA